MATVNSQRSILLQQRGVIAIEMAFALPIFLVFVLTSVEVARFFWAQHWLNENLHRAVRNEALNPGAGVENRLTRQLNTARILLPADSVRVVRTNVGWFTNANGPVERYQATAQLKFALLPWTDISVSSVSWLANNENQIR